MTSVVNVDRVVGHEAPVRYTARTPPHVELLWSFSEARAATGVLNDADIPFLTKDLVMSAGPSPQRVRLKHIDWVRERLGERDQKILITVAQFRLIQSTQLERLHFADLPASHRSRTRRRVLARLVDWRVLVTLDRRVGGVRAGSAGLVYALDTAGQWLADLADRAHGSNLAVRRPEQPSTRLLAHTLGVTELYVQLQEHAQRQVLTLEAFATEPSAWVPNGMGGWLKPDAYLAVAAGNVTDHWWLEHDEATESLPTIRKKMIAYLDFVRRGQRGPRGWIPRVLLSVPTVGRRDAIQPLIEGLPEPASRLLCVTTHARAAPYIVDALKE